MLMRRQSVDGVEVLVEFPPRFSVSVSGGAGALDHESDFAAAADPDSIPVFGQFHLWIEKLTMERAQPG